MKLNISKSNKKLYNGCKTGDDLATISYNCSIIEHNIEKILKKDTSDTITLEGVTKNGYISMTIFGYLIPKYKKILYLENEVTITLVNRD
jgi:hypothetical protein